MPARIAITLTDEQKAQLERIAEARQETVAVMVQEAVAEYLDYDAEFRKAVQEGIAAVERGDVRDWEEVEAELREKFGDFDG